MCGASVFNKLKDRNQIIGSVVLFIYIMVLIICDIYYSVHTLLGEMRYKKKSSSLLVTLKKKLNYVART